MFGLPCADALYCIGDISYNVNDFVHCILRSEAFKNIYKHPYFSVPDESRWPSELHDNMFPPIIIRATGRPSTKKRKKADETRAFKRSSNVRCSNCDEWGHNEKTCKVGKG